MEPIFTYIIGYRDVPGRIINLRRVIDWLLGFNGIEIIVVEQDKTSKLSGLDLKCKHIFTYSTLPYNRSWAFNVGIRYAKSDKLIFGDSDIIMNPNDIISAILELENYDTVNPYSKVIDLSREEIGYNLDQLSSINRPGRGETNNQKTNFSGGIVIMRKNASINVGGWDEFNFVGWGGEDDNMTNKIERFLKHKQMDARAYHIWHPPAQVDNEFYKRSLEALNVMNAWSNDEMRQFISKTVSLIGLKNKYMENV